MSDDRFPRTLVVVPALNEERSVAHVVQGVLDSGLEVVVIDDGSTDGTARTAEDAGARVVRLPLNVGVGAALRCGFRFAVAEGYETVVQCDGDGQHPPAAIVSLLEAQRALGVQLLIGSRFGPQDTRYPTGRVRRSTMRLLARSASAAAGSPITDATSGFRVISGPLLRAFARSFPDHYLGDTYEALVSAGRAGYAIREVPVEMRVREHGTSSANALAAAQFTLRALVVVGSRLHFPLAPMTDQR